LITADRSPFLVAKLVRMTPVTPAVRDVLALPRGPLLVDGHRTVSAMIAPVRSPAPGPSALAGGCAGADATRRAVSSASDRGLGHAAAAAATPGPGPPRQPQERTPVGGDHRRIPEFPECHRVRRRPEGPALVRGGGGRRVRLGGVLESGVPGQLRDPHLRPGRARSGPGWRSSRAWGGTCGSSAGARRSGTDPGPQRRGHRASAVGDVARTCHGPDADPATPDSSRERAVLVELITTYLDRVGTGR